MTGCGSNSAIENMHDTIYASGKCKPRLLFFNLSIIINKKLKSFTDKQTFVREERWKIKIPMTCRCDLLFECKFFHCYQICRDVRIFLLVNTPSIHVDIKLG